MPTFNNADLETMVSITTDSGRVVVTSGVCNLTETINSAGSHGSNNEWSTGLDFVCTGINNADTITVATLRLQGNGTYDAAPNVVTLYASLELTGAPPALNSTSGDLRAIIRPRTIATTLKTVTSVVASTWYEWDLTAAMQEVVNLPTYASGNRVIALIDTGIATTTGEWQDFNLTAELVVTVGGAVTRIKDMITSDGVMPKKR